MPAGRPRTLVPDISWYCGSEGRCAVSQKHPDEWGRGSLEKPRAKGASPRGGEVFMNFGGPPGPMGTDTSGNPPWRRSLASLTAQICAKRISTLGQVLSNLWLGLRLVGSVCA